MTQAGGLTCPKCTADMRTYERNGVTVDQCTGCGGLFLDRGELERLVQAESSYYSPAPAAQQRHHGKKHKKRSFLEELFD
jgi:Zn-finger nucleic acid-binding protein